MTAAESLEAWRTVQQDKTAESWMLPRERFEELMGTLGQGFIQSGGYRPPKTHVSRFVSLLPFALQVDRAIQALAPEDHKALAYVLLKGMEATGEGLRAQRALQEIGIDPADVEALVLARIENFRRRQAVTRSNILSNNYDEAQRQELALESTPTTFLEALPGAPLLASL